VTNTQSRGSIRLAAALLGLWFSGVAATTTVYALRLHHLRGMYAVTQRVAAEGLIRPLNDMERVWVLDGDDYYGAMERARQGITMGLEIGIAGPLAMAVLVALGFWVWRGFRPRPISS
jgi:hypothetical protein